MNLKKRVMFIFLSVFVTILLLQNAIAVNGVSPAYYELDFQPNLKQVFTFSFIGDEGNEYEIYLDGDLIDYAKLSRDRLYGSGQVSVLLELPDDVEKPGIHRLLVGAKQLPNSENGIAIVGNVRAVIKVRVPYPGEYAELDFSTSNANAGENVDFDLKIYSRGKNQIHTVSRIEIYDFNNNLVKTLPLGSKIIGPSKMAEYRKSLDTSGYLPGRYNAVAIVEYDGKEAVLDREFRLGELFVEVVNYTTEFEKKSINRFDIIVESHWNDPIDNLFANVSVVNYNISFITPSISLNGFEISSLTGYLDTNGIEEENFQAKVILHYEGEISEKLVDLRMKESINYILVAGTITVLLLIILLAYYIYRRRRK